MKYKNTKTNYVLETNCKIEGKNWILLEKEKPKKKSNKKGE